MDSKAVAFLGLGVMGYPMAGHLARAGHRLTVYNRSPAKAAKWVEQHGGRSAPTPAAAAAGVGALRPPCCSTHFAAFAAERL